MFLLPSRRSLLLLLVLFFSSMTWLGCKDENSGGGGKSGENGIWLTYGDDTYAMTIAVNTVNNSIMGDSLMFTIIGGGLNDKAKDLNGESNTGDVFDAMNMATLRFVAEVSEGQVLQGASFTFDGDDTFLHVDGGVGDIPDSLISKSGTLTIDRIEYQDKELFGDGDDPIDLTSNMKIQRLDYHFDGVFVQRSEREGATYPVSGKVAYTSKK